MSSKRAEAQQVMGQLQTLSDQLERARSQYDAATTQLARIQREQRENRYELHVAKHNLKVSQATIAARLRALYTSDQESTLEVILGAHSLDDVITGLDNAKTVASVDTSILAQVKQFKTAIRRSGDRLKNANEQQSRVVAERAAAKHEIESKISQAQSLYSSLQGEIKRLVAAQQAHQAELQREAQQRLQEEQQQQQQQQSQTVVGISAATPSNDVVAPPSSHSGAVGYALSQVGVPYVWGGATPGVGFDCSGLVMWAFAQVGVSLPHSSYAMWNYGVPVSENDLEPGDILFFDGLGHVGLYIGNGEFVEAPHTGADVQISTLGGWYAASYVGARRIL
ncbi:MAG TPA: NlpC/P60 family protein [Gaiellaceae bacterium]|nr:NlpC/P60 family protein [Gaiellaceae bacterium]